ncbi:hypothetical protein N7451_006789 [Penicillium sp. IBT 35674x]|nr:hypothetical protein N7451_006789 [Penicillium sp. IBT 35674x]
MCSSNVYRLLEATYPNPPLPAFSELGYDIELHIHESICLVFSKLIEPSFHINLPQRTLEAVFKGTAERDGPISSAVDMKENANRLKEKMCDLMEVLLNHQNNGPFMMGAQPCYTDFLLVGILACAQVVDEEIFKRLAKYLLFGKPYEACLPFMEKKG